MGPTVHRRAGLPDRVDIYEVGARDGLQNESAVIPAATKVALIARLVDAGLRTVEASSFVSPRWIPQLGDAAEVFAALTPVTGVRYPVLVPNEAGLDRALAAGARDVAVFASATETFARRNLNRTMAEALAGFVPVVARAAQAGCEVRGYVSMCFGDPWEGAVPLAQVVDVAVRLIEMGCDQLSIGDTIGVATPGHCSAHWRRPGSGWAGWRSTSTTPTARPWLTPWPPCSRG
jgi:hydroxymethylglutaryl-CoA lyase